MSPRPRLWPELPEDPATLGLSPPAAQFAQTLEQHVQDGLSSELALDLALNELVVSATAATGASAAALALARGQDMVCRATTGDHAPDLGIPLNAHSGLSAACVRTRKAQHCIDTETDERVDMVAAARLGIHSILAVPILDGENAIGVIEVFSRHRAAFSESDEAQLQDFALECLKLQRLSVELTERPPHRLEHQSPQTDTPQPPKDTILESTASDPNPEASITEPPGPAMLAPGTSPDVASPQTSLFSTAPASRIDTWMFILTVVVIVVAVLLTFLIGFRTGWLRARSAPTARVEAPEPANSAPNHPIGSASPEFQQKSAASVSVRPATVQTSPPAASDGLVVYERGKVVFRETQKAANPKDGKLPSENTSAVPRVWLAPAAAEARLRDRVEPAYPSDARAAHFSGDVTLEVLVRDDGSVASTRTLSGDPLLAESAAVAVHNWRYDPFQLKGRPVEFQTEVTLKFSLPQ